MSVSTRRGLFCGKKLFAAFSSTLPFTPTHQLAHRIHGEEVQYFGHVQSSFCTVNHGLIQALYEDIDERINTLLHLDEVVQGVRGRDGSPPRSMRMRVCVAEDGRVVLDDDERVVEAFRFVVPRAVAVDLLQCRGAGEVDLVWADADHGAVFSVEVFDPPNLQNGTKGLEE